MSVIKRINLETGEGHEEREDEEREETEKEQLDLNQRTSLFVSLTATQATRSGQKVQHQKQGDKSIFLVTAPSETHSFLYNRKKEPEPKSGEFQDERKGMQ